MGVPIGGIISLLTTVIVIYILFVLCYSAYLYFSPNTSRPSGWYWPAFVNGIIGIGPQTFSSATSNIAGGNDLLNTLSNVRVNDCMANCNVTSGCIGFVMNTSSNTCNTFTVISSILTNATTNVFVIDGNTPSTFYNLYPSSTMLAGTSNIIAYQSNGPTDCASNCSSNTTCTGFIINATGMCLQQSNIYFTSSNLVASTTYNSYIPRSATFKEVGAPYATSSLFG